MGHPTNRNHPDEQRQTASIRDACLDAEVPVGRITHNPKAAQTAIDDGYQILRIGGEATQKTIQKRLDQI